MGLEEWPSGPEEEERPWPGARSCTQSSLSGFYGTLSGTFKKDWSCQELFVQFSCPYVGLEEWPSEPKEEEGPWPAVRSCSQFRLSGLNGTLSASFCANFGHLCGTGRVEKKNPDWQASMYPAFPRVHNRGDFFRLKLSKSCGENVKSMKILDIYGIKCAVIIPLLLICSRLLRRIQTKRRNWGTIVITFACSRKERNCYLVLPAWSTAFYFNCKKECNAIINGKRNFIH